MDEEERVADRHAEAADDDHGDDYWNPGREAEDTRGSRRLDPVTGAVDDDHVLDAPPEAEPEGDAEGTTGADDGAEDRPLWMDHDPAVDAEADPETTEDHPWFVDVVGRLGVRLGVVSVLLAVVGIAAAGLGVRPFGQVAMVASLGMVTVAMLLGVVVQAYVGEVPLRPNLPF